MKNGKVCSALIIFCASWLCPVRACTKKSDIIMSGVGCMTYQGVSNEYAIRAEMIVICHSTATTAV